MTEGARSSVGAEVRGIKEAGTKEAYNKQGRDQGGFRVWGLGRGAGNQREVWGIKEAGTKEA